MLKSGVHRQIYATIAASMSIFISGMWLGWPSSASEKFVKNETGELHVTYDQLSWIVCMMDLGNFISPLFGGYLMDRFGRKKVIAALGPLFIVSWLLTLFVPTTFALYTARLMAGLGKGVSYTVVPVFLGEIAGVDIRGALGSVFTIQLSGGVLFEVIIGPYVSYHTLNATSAVVPVLFFAAFIWVPESPYYLLKVGRPADAARCLRWYRGCDAGSDSDNGHAIVAAELQLMEVNVRKDMENGSAFSELFTNRNNFRALAVVLVACAGQRAGGISSLTAYSALILPEPSPIMGKFEFIIAFAVVLVVVNFVGLAMVDRVGRKPLLISSEVGLGLVTFVFGVYYFAAEYFADAAASFRWLPYVCHTTFAATFSIGIGFIPVVFLGEMFPVNVRSRCSAFASVTLAFFSFLSNKTFLAVSLKYGYYTMFWTFSAVNFTCAYFLHRYAIETTNKTFLEIQEILDDSVRNGLRSQKKRPDIAVTYNNSCGADI
ncbi:facilitated trehalose transporter Tret1-like [Rhopalosiphum maidis]|uniref:facilitated trehalose transporter Tret1-like n=1 Tax=Rhopalosiphum maidis TaxID=43146 RepID=UPI000EFE55B7|nr:facilitated trehalose transporter Tret1-like [Rhopalosiphum maidis]XP_026808863.1 facilitated trehalose transporter Tret1-like [Rhopalosiphum maidis]XP_026808864.1 facilitated trehalose transporter Tret1-like [Rhopalosiphum maidis]XP_026808865.1 facilitated trehalose transporter Tret1-like [Rhopalosiphum maidis]XP_026808866.1 facilitated trehalose transporter Tret1-like [Rhopalosiphum maidis]XP_026808868.1 facilitated trehalose transporter Tret1-like [Rhopalosiphum maidis]XP_026808869.1 fa